MFDPIAVSFWVYTLLIVLVGLYSARFSNKSESDFFLAGRGLGPWVAALSSSASAESGWVTMGLVGIAYTTGIGALWIVVGTFCAFLFNWFVLTWRLRTVAAQHNALTIPDVLAAPFKSSAATVIRIVGVLIILSMTTAYVAAQLNAAGKAFNGTFGWEYSIGVFIGSGIILAYTMTGGFRAIAWTDVVQATFMILTMTLLPIILMSKIGGPAVFWSKLAADSAGATLTDPFAGKAGLSLLGFLALWFGVPLGNTGQPHVLLRLMAVRDKKTVLRGGIIASTWVLVLFTGAVTLGMTARVYYGDLVDPENTLSRIAVDSNIVPGFIGGMIMATIFAAICSTADSQLLVSASAVSHDLYVRVFGGTLSHTGRRILDRLALLFVGLLATVIAAAEVRSVFKFVLYCWDGLGAGFGPALILSLFWRRATGWGVAAGMVVGVTTAIGWRQFPALHGQLYGLIPAFAAATVAIIVVSLLTPEDRADVDQFSTHP
jgi:sodium/proline symporter